MSSAGDCHRDDHSRDGQQDKHHRTENRGAAARKSGSYLQAQFHRLRTQRGAKKAIGAFAASILTAAYHMLKDGTLYHDLGPDHFDRHAKMVQTRRLLTRVQRLGYAAQITPLAA